MGISTIILAHNKEREGNIKTIVDSLMNSSIVPDKITVFIDNPEIKYEDTRVNTVISKEPYPVIVRFALGVCEQADRILMIDDDLAVGKETIDNFIQYSLKYPDSLLGLEGNILSSDDYDCYTNGETVDRGHVKRNVDILIRTYFTTSLHLVQALYTRELFKDRLPEKSIDDIILCMSNKYSYSGNNIVIPIDKDSDVVELTPAGVGQCTNPNHYINRNLACSILR